MTTFLVAVAIIGLAIFAVGAILYLVDRPSKPVYPLLMVIGGLLFAVAEIIVRIDALI